MVSERGGYDLMPEMGTRPVNKYLPPRPTKQSSAAPVAPADKPEGFLAWLDRALEKLG
jgi:hypothetical protein